MTQKTKKADFSGYATRYNIRCKDGRTILAPAFAHMDGRRVPLVWQHLHDTPDNILGHAVLTARKDGIYAEAYLNQTTSGVQTKEVVMHGDIESLSIFANDLEQSGKGVREGNIRELSVVLAGSNPGAKIDFIDFGHGDGDDDLSTEAIIYGGDAILFAEDKPSLSHAASAASDDSEDSEETIGDILAGLNELQEAVVMGIIIPMIMGAEMGPAGKSAGSDDGPTVQEVFDTLTDKQKNAVYAFAAQAADSEGVAQSDTQEGSNSMKHNIFYGKTTATNEEEEDVLTHAQQGEILGMALNSKRSLREALGEHLEHAGTYGIDDIEYLFPEGHTNVNPGGPVFIMRDQAWVGSFMSGVNHRPFSRIKSIFADITADEARAKGYVKGAEKLEEVFGLLKRVTTATTIYKKQKLDRDDVIDIVDFDVVAWMKGEMKVLLNEEAARACLVGDGRSLASPDKVNETNLRPIYKDDPLYTISVKLASTITVDEMVDEVLRARVGYTGSGNLTLFISPTLLTEMLLVRDEMGHRLYRGVADLQVAMRVNNIVETSVFENVVREIGVGAAAKDYALKAIALDLSDYTIGADAGGKLGMFDDFDIDFNQMKYLIETRISGALTMPKSAIVIEQEVVGG